MSGIANRACGICGGDGILSRSHTEDGWDYEECPCTRREVIESMEKSGYDLKDEGCAQVVANTDEEIKAAVYAELDNLIELQPHCFTTDDLHHRADKFLKMAHNNFVGGAISSAIKRGLIEWTGQVTASTRPKAKARILKIWRKALG
jgi:hypothetical protein